MPVPYLSQLPEPQSFVVESGSLDITDPCYSKDTWCSIRNAPALNGTWQATIAQADVPDWGRRVTNLIAWNEQHPLNPRIEEGELRWEIGVGHVEKGIPGDLGVDSGQMGVFDSSKFPEGGGKDDEFYDRVCELTLASSRWGVVSEGAVSSSGFGDGSYQATGIYQAGTSLLVAVIVTFIDDRDFEETEESAA